MNSNQTISQDIIVAQATKPSDAMLEWLECQDFILSIKAHRRCWDPVQLQSLPHFQAEIKPMVTKSKSANKTIEQQIDPFFYQYFNLSEGAMDMADAVAQQIPSALAQLKAASLGEKRQVLRYMHIVSPAVSAAFLGTSEDIANELKSSDSFGVPLGKNYAGSHSFSMAELELIADNTVWVECGDGISLKKAQAAYDETILDHVTLVDEETAIAFTNLSSDELHAAVPRTSHTRRPYRLADLEEIRVAKMKALAH